MSLLLKLAEGASAVMLGAALASLAYNVKQVASKIQSQNADPLHVTVSDRFGRRVDREASEANIATVAAEAAHELAGSGV